MEAAASGRCQRAVHQGEADHNFGGREGQGRLSCTRRSAGRGAAEAHQTKRLSCSDAGALRTLVDQDQPDSESAANVRCRAAHVEALRPADRASEQRLGLPAALNRWQGSPWPEGQERQLIHLMLLIEGLRANPLVLIQAADGATSSRINASESWEELEGLSRQNDWL